MTFDINVCCQFLFHLLGVSLLNKEAAKLYIPFGLVTKIHQSTSSIKILLKCNLFFYIDIKIVSSNINYNKFKINFAE